MELYNSLKSRLETFDKPFKHWAINQPLTEKAIKSNDRQSALKMRDELYRRIENRLEAMQP